MSLRIRFTNKTDYEPVLALGEITLNEFIETFETDLTFWGAERYESQWREGIDRLLQGVSRSCLITSLVDSSYQVFGQWWKLYRDGEQVVVQNQLLLSSCFGKDFNPNDPYSSISDRQSLNSEGEQISEWFVDFAKIKSLESDQVS
jgi:hypothetical protein